MKIIYLLSLLPIIIFCMPNAFGDEMDVFIENIDEPVNYEISVRLINVIDVDRLNGHYTLDFWYSIESDEVDFTKIDHPKVDFTNGFVEDTSLEYLEEHYFEKRIRGTFFNVFDFKDFPFDKNELNIQLEINRPWTISKAKLNIAEDSGLDPSATVPGYIISKGPFYITTHTYESEEETYESYNAIFIVEKSPIGSFLKIIFPILIVVGIGYVAYMFPKNYDLQAALALLPLGAVVFLQVSTLDNLPPLGYLTIFDKMMVIVYALIANNVISIGRQVSVEHHNENAATYKISKFHLKVSPIIAIVLGVMLFFVL